MNEVLPLARKDYLVIKEVENETLVYDLETDQAHCLNDTAARVWNHCDGQTTVSEIAGKLGDTKSTALVDENLVWLALDQLEKFKLLVKSPANPARLSGMTRRQMVARLGLAAVALPVIVSIVSPTARAAGSVLPDDSCCNNPNECASNCCAHRPNQPLCPPPNKVCVGLTPSTSGPICQDL